MKSKYVAWVQSHFVAHISLFDILRRLNESISSGNTYFTAEPRDMGVHGFQRKTEKCVLELEKIVNAPKSLICPNVECGKAFQKVLILTDLSKMPHETYYACPHCFSRVDIVKEEKSPLECPYYFGFLKTFPKKTPIPNECLTCPKIIQCKKGKLS